MASVSEVHVCLKLWAVERVGMLLEAFSSFFFSGREAMLIYMRGHPAQQITEPLVDFIFPTR